MAPSVVAMSRVAPPSAASSTLLQSSISRPGIDDQPRRAAPPQRHPGRSRSGAEAQTREPLLARRQVAGEPRRRIRAGAGNVAEWVPDTAASAALGGRSGMTRQPSGSPGPPRRRHASGPAPAARRFRARAAPPQRHPGRSRSGAEARTREPFRARRQVAGEPRRRIRAGAGNVAEWVPDTAASAALGGRSGMTRRLCGFPGGHPKRPTDRGQPANPSGATVLARALAARPPPSASSRAKPERRRGPGSHSAPVDRQRPGPGVTAFPAHIRVRPARACPARRPAGPCAGAGRGLVARGTRGRSPRGVLRPTR